MLIQFPETLMREWQDAALAANAHRDLRKRLEREAKVEAEIERLRVRHLAGLAFTAELEAGKTQPVEIQTMAEFMLNNSPVLVDVVEGVVKDNSLCMMLGPAGAGKSSLMVQMAHSLLTGGDWLGQPVQQVAGKVGILSYDQSVAIPVNWMSKMGVPLDRVFPIDLNGKGNPLKVPTERARLAATFRAANVEVLFIDSFSASFSGDQNDAGLVMAWYADVKQFALSECGARIVVVLVHSTKAHPLKPRGSTVHEDVADSVVAVVREADNSRRVEMVKYRAGLNQSQMEPVYISKPDSVTHLVELDLGKMSLSGMQIPVRASGSAFPDLPETHEAPDTDSEDEEGEGETL